jgi:hypothetical protein
MNSMRKIGMHLSILSMVLVSYNNGQEVQPAPVTTGAAPAASPVTPPVTAEQITTPSPVTPPTVTGLVTTPTAPVLSPIPTPPVIAPVPAEAVTTTTPELSAVITPPTPVATPSTPVATPAAASVPTAAGLTTTATPNGIDATLDTVDIQEGGNWLKVRKALENTVDAIENINVLFTKILDERMTFLKKRNKADKDFEKFLQSFGMDIGDFDRQMTQLIEHMEQDRKDEGVLSEEERALLTAAQQKKEAIKELKNEVTNIGQLDTRIDDILMALEDQINTCRDYQSQAWKNFQAIKKVYNDEKAERLYQKTEILFTNMQAIYGYLQGDLSQYLDSTIQMLTDAISKADASVKDLQSKGVNLRETLQKLEQKDKQASMPQEGEAPKVQPTPKKVSWFTSITNTISGVMSSIGNFFGSLMQSVMNLFVKKPAVKPVAVPQGVAPEQSAAPQVPAEETAKPAEEEKSAV